MLKLPFQFQHRLHGTIPLSEAEIVRVPAGRCLLYGAVFRSSGILVTRHRKQQVRVLDKEVFVDAWNLKRSGRYKLFLSQQIQGTARDVSPTGLLLEPLSYPIPTTETNDSNETSAGIDEEQLNALVAKARLRISSDKEDTLLHHAEPRKGGSGSKRTTRNGRDEKNWTKKLNGRKQTWQAFIEGMDASQQKVSQEMVDIKANSDHLRQLEEKLLFLESLNVDTSKVLTSYPAIVNIGSEKLKSVINYLESCGMKRSNLGRVLSMTPHILGLSVKNQLRPAVTFLLKEVGLSKKDLVKVIHRCPRLLAASVNNQLRPTMEYLQGLGFIGMEAVVSTNATLLTFSIQTKLLPKLQFLQTLGMSADDAVKLVVRFPAIFNYGVEQNLRPKFDYLVEVMGLGVDDLKAFPQYFGYSLDYRIRPRHEFLVQRNIKMSLRGFLKLSDEQFHLRFKDLPVEAGEIPNHAAATESQAVNYTSSPVHICP